MADANAKIAELNAIIGSDFDPVTYESLNGSNETFIGLLKFKREIEQNSDIIVAPNAPKTGYAWATEGGLLRIFNGEILDKNELSLLFNGKKGVTNPYLLKVAASKEEVAKLFKYLEESDVIVKA